LGSERARPLGVDVVWIPHHAAYSEPDESAHPPRHGGRRARCDRQERRYRHRELRHPAEVRTATPSSARSHDGSYHCTPIPANMSTEHMAPSPRLGRRQSSPRRAVNDASPPLWRTQAPTMHTQPLLQPHHRNLHERRPPTSPPPTKPTPTLTATHSTVPIPLASTPAPLRL
jgi:hypothetical protein